MPRKGENIYKRKDGRWEGRYIKSHINGRAKYGYIYAKSYKEAKEKLNKFRNATSEEKIPISHTCVSSALVPFGTIADKWLESLQPNIKESSYIKYSNLLKHYIFPRFRNTPIGSISRNDISSFCIEMQYKGGKNGDGLSSKTVMCIISVLKNVFKYAVQCENIIVVDINNITVKQSQLKPLRILSMQEQKKLHNYLVQDLSLTNLGILLCLYTGIRIGEVCALQWEDISYEEKYLYVHKTMQRIQSLEGNKRKTSILISTPKSECSIRKIPIPETIFQLLYKFNYPGNTYLLTGHKQKFVEPRTLQYRFKAILKTCNINDANFHSLRHTFATRCIELGFDVKSLSEILGHATVNITLNRYVHPSMELKQKNMNMLSELFAVK